MQGAACTGGYYGILRNPMDSLESIGFLSIPWNAGRRIHWIPFPFLFCFFALCLLKVFGILPDAWPNSFYSTPCARAPRALRARFARAKPTQAADHQSSGRTNWFAAGARASRAPPFSFPCSFPFPFSFPSCSHA